MTCKALTTSMTISNNPAFVLYKMELSLTHLLYNTFENLDLYFGEQ